MIDKTRSPSIDSHHPPATMPLPKSVASASLSQILLILFLASLVGFGAIPSYLKGKWHIKSPEVAEIEQLRKLRQSSLNLSDWQVYERETKLKIGGHQWLFEHLQPIERKAVPGNLKDVVILLLPQLDHQNQPEVEWTDIDGYWQWNTDSYQQLKFNVITRSHSVPVTARLFRSWTKTQTFAVLQWYAWPMGGHPAPSHWFWADRLAQLSDRRVPWVAVSILVPIEPLGEIEPVKPALEAIAQEVQKNLMKNVFSVEISQF